MTRCGFGGRGGFMPAPRGIGRQGALLRECPPDRARPVLLLYFATQSALSPDQQATAANKPLVFLCAGGPRTLGGRRSEIKEEGRRSRPGGHSRSRPPSGLGQQTKPTRNRKAKNK